MNNQLNQFGISQKSGAINCVMDVSIWQGLYIELDTACRVRDCKGALAARLDDAVNTAGIELAHLLAEPPAWAAEDFPILEGQALDLSFRGRAGTRLHTRGWLERLPGGWSLWLLDVSDQVERARAQERRLRLLDHGAELGRRLRLARNTDRDTLLDEFLEGLVLRLAIPGAGVLVAQADRRWRLARRFVQPRAPAFPDERALQRLPGLVDNAPRSVRLDATGDLWLVPHGGRDGVEAYLVCHAGTAETSDLTREDWMRLVDGVVAPWLQHLRDETRREEDERNACLQDMLGSGWWEYCSQTGRYLLGPCLGDALGVAGESEVDWPALVHPADRDEFRVRLADVAAAGGQFVQALRLSVAGSWRWFRLSARAQRQRVIGFAVDIDDIKANEAVAAAATARLESLVDSAPAIIYVQHCEEGVLRPEFFSASLEVVLGWTLAELCERSLLSLVHEDDRDIFLKRTRRLLREGKASCHYRMRDRHGGYHWILDEAKMLRDDYGRPLEAVGLYLDVTEAREAAERVRQSEERYRLLVEDSPSMICRYRPDLSLSFANRPLLDYLGCPPELVGSLSLVDYLSDEQCEAFRRRIAALTPEQPLCTAEIRVQLPGHEHAWWLWAERGVFDCAGRLVEIQAVGRDDTELHRSRQQLHQSAKMATLGTMATGIAHEISQPLNVMRAALMNLLKRVENGGLTDEYLAAKLERIEGQVQRAARIVNHMRGFGRRSEVEWQRFRPRAAIEGAVALICEDMQQQGIRLELELAELPEVCGHADQLEQVLINLLVNARDALLERKAREPTLQPWVRLGAGAREGRVRVEVQDNAGGIEPELLERVFDPFFTTKPVGQGTGLGLSVSYGIIRQMGGELTARNESSGACFSVDLPAG